MTGFYSFYFLSLIFTGEKILEALRNEEWMPWVNGSKVYLGFLINLLSKDLIQIFTQLMKNILIEVK